MISIHALLAESDSSAASTAQRWTDFNPRSPCGERHGSGTTSHRPGDFNPRSPCGERPRPSENESENSLISIHALLAESDGFVPREEETP